MAELELASPRSDELDVREIGDSPLHFVLKTVSRCNLDCSYCYVYNKGDTTWKARPPLIRDDVFDAALDRIRRWCVRSGQPWVKVTFHGGEPLLAGPRRFGDWCRRIKEGLAGVAEVTVGVQTNATLIDERWTDLFREHQVEVGISVDGPKDVHDRNRVDHLGRGSYDDVARGVGRMKEAGLPVSILCVIPFGEDGVRVHRHLESIGADSVSYLLPDFTHDTIGPVREQYGPTPCADFLLPIFDHWWFEGTLDTKISLFWTITRLILGGDSNMDLLGNKPFGFLFIESDGFIEGLDVLRVCGNGMAGGGANVLTHDIDAIADLSPLHRGAIFTGLPRPAGCAGCPEETTCAGGYLPHRWSMDRGFDNPSVWCADLLKIFGHLRGRLEVSPDETLMRRRVLHEMAEEALLANTLLETPS